MRDCSTTRLPVQRDAIAPVGSAVRLLLRLSRGRLAHVERASGHTSIAVAHRTVEAIWCFLHARGDLWRKPSDHEDVVPVDASVCITSPCASHFQFRSLGYEPLATTVQRTWPRVFYRRIGWRDRQGAPRLMRRLGATPQGSAAWCRGSQCRRAM